MFNVGTKVWFLNGTKIEYGAVCSVEFKIDASFFSTYDELINKEREITPKLTYDIKTFYNKLITKNYDEVFQSKEALILTLEKEIEYAKPLPKIPYRKEISLKELLDI